MENLRLVFEIVASILCLWMCFRWSTNTLKDSMIKVVFFLTALTGIYLTFKDLHIE